MGDAMILDEHGQPVRSGNTFVVGPIGREFISAMGQHMRYYTGRRVVLTDDRGWELPPPVASTRIGDTVRVRMPAHYIKAVSDG